MSPAQRIALFTALFSMAATHRIFPSARLPHDFRAHLEMHSVIPDVINVAPQEACEVIYIQGVRVDLGRELYPSQVKYMPWWVTFPVETDAFYTLIMTDPDYPARKGHKLREFQHWLVVNMPETGVLAGDTITEYYSPQPANGTGLHRYVFTIFKQPHGKINVTERKIPEKQKDYRGSFRTMKFAQKYGLGDPVAANLFQAQYTPKSAITEDPTLTTVGLGGTLPPSTRMPSPNEI